MRFTLPAEKGPMPMAPNGPDTDDWTAWTMMLDRPMLEITIEELSSLFDRTFPTTTDKETTS